MNNKLYLKVPGKISLIGILAKLSVLFLFVAASAWADSPEWMRSAASIPIPKYSDETKAVLLYDETTIIVKDAGEVRSIHRRVYRILRSAGRDRGTFDVSFDK